MTDNYQIDKNSKLFQKFLNLKNNKNAQPTLQRPIPGDPSQTIRPNIKIHEQSKQQLSNEIQSNHLGKLKLHMTISDVEQAASMSMVEQETPKNRKDKTQRQNVNAFEEKQKVEHQTQYFRKNEQKISIGQQYNESRAYESYKPRQRRTRDFNDRNKNKNQKSFRTNDPQVKINAEIPLKIDEGFKRQKQNLMSLNENDEPIVKQEHMFTLGTRQGEYKKKYQKINEKYEELKQTLQKQRKLRQQQLNDKQAQMELVRQKYFQVRSNEDSLTSQLKRIKQKLQSENMIRTKFQEEVKQLNFKIQELQDMLDGKEANLKKKLDQTNHWKTQNQQFRNQNKALEAQIEKLQDRCQYLESQNKMIKKDIHNKENLIEEFRRNINNLIEENNIAKDEIYRLTIKAYHYQQQNQVLKGDLMRRDREQPHQMSVIQQNFMRSIQSLSPKRRQGKGERMDKMDHVMDRPQRGERNQPVASNNRRRQFARQRAVTSKPQKQDREERKMVPQNGERRVQQNNQRRTEPPTSGKYPRQVMSRVQFLQSELEKRNEQKAMNGKLRRQKIQMQRELQQLLSKLN